MIFGIAVNTLYKDQTTYIRGITFNFSLKIKIAVDDCCASRISVLITIMRVLEICFRISTFICFIVQRLNLTLLARHSYRVTPSCTNKHCKRDLLFTKLLHLDIPILFRGSADQFSEDIVLNGANTHNRKLAV